MTSLGFVPSHRGLLKGRQPIIWVLARKLWTPRGVPKACCSAIDEGRLLVVSPVSQTVRRVDAQSAAIRNRYILEHSRQVVFAALDPYGELARLLARVRSVRPVAFDVL